MNVGIDLKCEGLEDLRIILKELRKTGSEFKGVQLRGINREDSIFDNAEILEYLHKSGRKFGDLFDNETSDISERCAREMEKQVSESIRRASKKGVTLEKSSKWSKQVAAYVLREAMRVYMGIVRQHIETEQAPGGVKPLSDRYLNWKQRKYGFTTIGKLTGQLLENLDEATASSKITLVKY